MNKLLHSFAIVLLLGGALSGFSSSQVLAASMMEIAAEVNGDVISVSDVSKRLSLIIASSGLPPTPEIRNKLAPQIIHALIEEHLMLQEAARLKKEVSEEEIDGGFAAIAQQNGKSSEAFRSMLKSAGLDVGTMRDQIKAQIAWTKVVQSNIRPGVKISERDVDAYLERLQRASGSSEFLVSEIFIPVAEDKHEKDAQQLALRLTEEVRSGKAPFFKLAQQFSEAAGSVNGGDLGWVAEEQMEPKMLGALKILDKNKVSDPVRSATGYHIYLLRDKRSVSEETLPSRDQVFNVLGMQRLDKAQRRRLMDLRAASFIEIRG